MQSRSPQLIVMIIWGALVMSVVVYAVVASAGLGGEGASAPKKPDPALAQIFAWIAAAVSGVSLMLRPLFFGGFKSGKLTINSNPGMQRFMAGNIICFSMAEAVGILGLVLALIGHAQDEWLVFFAVGLVLLLIHIPLPGRFRARVRP